MSDQREPLTADQVIAKLGLAPLPGEGGFYRETYRSAVMHRAADQSPSARRSVGTAIYYFLTPDTYSALHRLRSDEVYHFYAGDPVEMTLVHPGGRLQSVALSNMLVADDVPQFAVPANVWQGSRLRSGGSWALLGTTVTPGFEFEDCEIAGEDLIRGWPQDLQQAVRTLLPR